MGPYCNRFLEKVSKLFRNLQELFKIDPFIEELPNENLACQVLMRALPGLANSISRVGRGTDQPQKGSLAA